MEKYFNYTYDNNDKFNINYYTNINYNITYNITNNIYLQTKQPKNTQKFNKLKEIKMRDKVKCNLCDCYIYNYNTHIKSKKHNKNFLKKMEQN